MKKTITFLYAATLLLALPASAQLNIIHAIPSPAELSLDIAYDGQHLWVSGALYESSIYQISKLDGSVIKELPKDPSIDPAGMAFANGYLWITDTDQDMIHKVDTTDGAIVFSFPSPSSSTNNYPSGMAWDGNAFWCADAFDGFFYQIDTLGNILNTSTTFTSGFVSGLAMINGNIWYTENISDGLYEMDPSDFSVLQSFNVDEGTYTNGLAFDGQYLWLAVADDDVLVDSIYQIDFGFPSAIDDIQSPITSITAYPNPVSNTLYLELSNFDQNQSSSLSIHNALGKTLIRTDKVSSKNNLDLTNLPSGIYVYTFEQTNGLYLSGKFVKK